MNLSLEQRIRRTPQRTLLAVPTLEKAFQPLIQPTELSFDLIVRVLREPHELVARTADSKNPTANTARGTNARKSLPAPYSAHRAQLRSDRESTARTA